MPDAEFSEGSVSRADLAALAELFDRSELTLNPILQDAKIAEAELEDRIALLYSERVKPVHPEVTFLSFRLKVKSLCRAYLRKN
jgi:hypothetical protein